MLKTTSTLLVMALGSLSVLGPPSLSASPSSAAASQGLAAASPTSLAGTYVTDLDYLDFATGQVRAIQNLTALHADGTLSSSDTDDFDPTAGGGTDSTAYGTWKFVGGKTTTNASLFYVYDATGVELYTVRNDWTTQFSPGGTGDISGSGETRVYFPGMDALDKDAGLPVGTFTLAGRRLDV